jgi:SnoaL-like protein
MTVNIKETIRQNLKSMDHLDFTAWNTPDWDLFRQLHTADVHVEVSGQEVTHGINAHVDAMKSLIEQSGGQPMQVQSHPISFGSGEWTCVVGEFASGARMVTVAKWHDGAIVEEYIWL